MERETALEQKVARLKAKLADLQERRVVAQFATPYVDGPRFHLDYDNAEIEVVAAARQRTARAQTSEPHTVQWLEESFRDGDVLYDIGANVGSYSLIAANLAPAARVYAFEPSFASFPVLCSNIALNRLGGRVVPIPLPLGAATAPATLAYHALGPGAGAHGGTVHVGEDTVFEQGALMFRLDDLVRLFGLSAPALVRLAAGGREPEIVAGAVETFSAPSLRSVIVELGSDDTLLGALAAHGFDQHEVHRRPGSPIRFATLRRAKTPAASA
jgi:FkbM family methyltransferase